MEKILVLFLFIFILFSSCSKKEEVEIGSAPSRIINKTKDVSNAIKEKYGEYDTIMDKGE